jgi:hypothetical protein
VDARLAKLREAIAAYDAYPATVDELAGDLEKWIKDRVAKDARDRAAHQALLQGIEAAPEKCDCHRSTVYRRAMRYRRKSQKSQPSATSQP